MASRRMDGPCSMIRREWLSVGEVVAVGGTVLRM
jgi:hypothetical protein